MTTVAELPKGYRDIPEEDQKKAKVFFDRGNSVAGTGNFEYAIEMYLQGLNIDPENIDAHQTLREFSLKRKASGGKDMGMFEKMKVKTNTADEKANMLAAEKLLAYDPGNTQRMLQVVQSAHKAGFFDTVMWAGAITMRGNAESKKPDFATYIALKNVYKDLERWKEAADAAKHAQELRPDDMDLQAEYKNLATLDTMDQGKYGKAKSFRESIRDMDTQRKLLDQDKDVRSGDLMSRAIAEAEAEWRAEPNEPGKLSKYVDALLKTERAEEENKAIEILEDAYERTKQFRWRQRVGQIKIAQLNRMDRSMRDEIQKNPGNGELKQRYIEFRRDKAETELGELTQWVEAYPTDTRFRFEMAKRLFELGRFDEAIPVFQHVRNDPKYRVDATSYLGRAFLENKFVDEAVETLKASIEDYQLRGDEKSKEMYYWYARALEEKPDTAAAIKSFSQVAQWDFNYRDVQQRIRALRAAAAKPPAT
jgi:tetratricopeptide (TPR) repeat protein